MKSRAEKKFFKDPKKRSSKGFSDKERLEGSKFRILNEQLYTTTSQEAKSLFDQSPHYFDIMHNGFATQATTWPVVPVDQVIKWILAQSKDIVIADMGCGDAKIANTVTNTVYSFDFKARNQKVIECDMSHTPLEDQSVDAVVFVLSLMGTNLMDFFKESRRILKSNGTLLIVEVSSRIENNTQFIKGVESSGFSVQKHKPLTEFFQWFEFKKTNLSSDTLPIQLKPCIYKRR